MDRSRPAPRSRAPELSTADPAGPGLAVVVLGLASAIAWGAGDFGGGWTGRRAPVLGIAIGIDLIGTVLMVGVALATGEPMPGLATLGLAALAGVLAVAGILGLYTGLAVGRMGVVAPVTGVIAATLPVVVGFVGLGLPRAEVVVGIALALGAVVLVSRSTDHSGRRSGIEYALLGGIGLGLFNIAVGAFPEHRVAWPLAVIKAGSLIPIVAIVVLGRRPWRIPRPIVPALLATAGLDLAGNGLYILATQAGRLDIAATLSSLYPVTTVVLAVILLHEQVTRSHLFGIMMAALAIALIAGGSAAPVA
ncbi:MAG TPA: EamA family transporter [Candidatus Limnocylindrales bacterium]|nr:EamA family transporter [Candidatus Limnocylindrales bacterium]